MIRPAQPRDMAQLVAMIHALAAHHGDAAMLGEPDLARDVFGDFPWLHVLVAEGNDGLCGYVALTQLARLQYGQRGMDLHHLYVCTAFQSQGIGRALLQSSLDFARALGCSYMTVSALADNTEAQAFYRKQGFTLAPVCGVRFGFDLARKG